MGRKTFTTTNSSLGKNKVTLKEGEHNIVKTTKEIDTHVWAEMKCLEMEGGFLRDRNLKAVKNENFILGVRIGGTTLSLLIEPPKRQDGLDRSGTFAQQMIWWWIFIHLVRLVGF